MPPKKAMPTCVAMKSCNRAPAMHGQRNHIFKCDPMKREAKKLQFRECESHRWLRFFSIGEEDGPWDSASMYGDLDSMD